jgi:hypothetical protein
MRHHDPIARLSRSLRRTRGLALVVAGLLGVACGGEEAAPPAPIIPDTPDAGVTPPREAACTRGAESSSLTALRRCGPPDNRVNLVFIGDGYTADELSTWALHVDGLSEAILTTAKPYDRYRNFINVYRIDVSSAESGVDDPDHDVFVDTALDGTNSCADWMTGHCQIDWKKTHAAIDAATPGIPVHWRFIGLHTTIFLGAAHYPPEGNLCVYATDVPDTFHIATHEGGHGFHLLGDEYVNPGEENTAYSGPEPTWPNLTLDPTGAKWQRWIGFEQPELGGPVGAYEGGLVTSGKGVYRPSPQSRMNHFVHELDAIGKEAVIHSIYAHVRPIDEHLGAEATVEGCEAPWLRVVDPAVIAVEWRVDGELVPGARGEELDVCALGLEAGLHTVRARAYDEVIDHAFSDNAAPHPLDLVRQGLESLEQSVEWQVRVP